LRRSHRTAVTKQLPGHRRRHGRRQSDQRPEHDGSARHSDVPELARIRDQQRVFLKANQKYPDFIEVGIDVWENVVDWHIRHQQPLSVSRSSEGRYIMAVGFTTLILRPELSDNYVGPGMDAR
jgi:hypothetical protein